MFKGLSKDEKLLLLALGIVWLIYGSYQGGMAVANLNNGGFGGK